MASDTTAQKALLEALVDRVLAQEDLEHGPVKIIAWYRLPHELVVQPQVRALVWHEIEVDGVTGLKVANAVDQGRQCAQACGSWSSIRPVRDLVSSWLGALSMIFRRMRLGPGMDTACPASRVGALR